MIQTQQPPPMFPTPGLTMGPPPSPMGTPSAPGQSPRFFHMPKFQQNSQMHRVPSFNNRRTRDFVPFQQLQAQQVVGAGGVAQQQVITMPGGFNAKQVRKPIHRKTIDYNTSIIKYLEVRYQL